LTSRTRLGKGKNYVSWDAPRRSALRKPGAVVGVLSGHAWCGPPARPVPPVLHRVSFLDPACYCKFKPSIPEAPCCCLAPLPFIPLVAVSVRFERAARCVVTGLELNPDRPNDKLPYRGAWFWIGPEMIHLMELVSCIAVTGWLLSLSSAALCTSRMEGKYSLHFGPSQQARPADCGRLFESFCCRVVFPCSWWTRTNARLAGEWCSQTPTR
jgi:hypothetical protein